MRVLLVNAYEDTKNGNEEFNLLRKCVISCLEEGAEGFSLKQGGEEQIIIRRSNALLDYIVDWDFDAIDDRARNSAVNFDTLDLIIVAGDLSILPWDSRYSHAITLLHIAGKVKKPVICLGSGAFACIYATCTGGTKYTLLNAPFGDNIQKLASFPFYASSVGQYPSAWLDNQTGDLYTYDTRKKRWFPACNTGIYRLSSDVCEGGNGKGANSPRPHDRKFVSDGNYQGGGMVRVAHFQVDNKEISASKIRQLSKGFTETCFPVTLMSKQWFVNWSENMPIQFHAESIADGPTGPMVLTLGNSLLMTCDLVRSAPLKTLFINYLKNLATQQRVSKLGKLCGSLYEYLFVKVEGTCGRCQYELDFLESIGNPVGLDLGQKNGKKSHKNPSLQRKIALPLAKDVSVPTSLPHGPILNEKFAMPMITANANPLQQIMLETHALFGDKVDSPRPDASLKNEEHFSMRSPVPKEKRVLGQAETMLNTLQNPKSMRMQRLESLMSKEWKCGANDISTVDQADTLKANTVSGGGSITDTKTKTTERRKTQAEVRRDTMISLLNALKTPRAADSPVIISDIKPEVPILEIPQISAWDEAVKLVENAKTFREQHTFNADTIPTSPPAKSKLLDKKTYAMHHAAMVHPRTMQGYHSHGCDDSIETPKYSPRPAVTPVAKQPVLARPFTNFKKYEQMNDVSKSDFQGNFTEPFMCEYEREKYEQRKSKEKNIGPAFRVVFGNASSIPLRQNGGVRPHGHYEDGSADVNGVGIGPKFRDDQFQKKRIPAPWRPVTAKPSSSRKM